MFDPYLSDSLTRKYATTNKPHERISELVINPELLDCIDIVTSSHNHTDHLDAETLIPILAKNKNVKFIIPEANRDFVVDRVKCHRELPIGLTDSMKKEIEGFTFHGVPAAHNEIERDEQGRCKFMGYVVQFGKFSVYHSGDTLWYDEMVKLLKPFQVDVAFLPINGNDPARGVAGNLNCEEAARLGKDIQTKRSTEILGQVRDTFWTFESALELLAVGDVDRPLFLPREPEVQREFSQVRQQWELQL